MSTMSIPRLSALRRRSLWASRPRCGAGPGAGRHHRQREPGAPAAAADRHPAFGGDGAGAQISAGGQRRPRALGPLPPARPGAPSASSAGRQRRSRPSTPGRRSAPRRCWPARSRPAPTGGCASISGCGTSTPATSWSASSSPPRPENWRTHRPQDRRRGLREADRREGLFRHPRGVRRRERAEDQARDAGWRSWTRTAPTPATSPTAPTMVFTPRFSAQRQEITYMALRADRRLDLPAQHRDRPRGGAGPVPGHEMFAPRFSPDGSKVAFSAEKDGDTDIYVMDLRQPRAEAADHGPGDRHLAVILAGRRPDRLQLRPRRLAAALCDERRRLGRAAHLVRRRPLHHAGLEPGRQADRLHQAGRARASTSG